MSRLLILSAMLLCIGCKNKLETEPKEPTPTVQFRKVGDGLRPGYVVTAAAACRTHLLASADRCFDVPDEEIARVEALLPEARARTVEGWIRQYVGTRRPSRKPQIEVSYHGPRSPRLADLGTRPVKPVDAPGEWYREASFPVGESKVEFTSYWPEAER